MSIARRRLVDGLDGRARFHFLVQWRDARGVQHSRTFSELGEAAAFDAAVKAGRIAREVPGAIAPVTFGQQAAWWLATKQQTKRAGTFTLYECELRRHVLPFFAHAPLVAIHRRDVQVWLNTLVAQGLAPATVRHCYRAVFKSVINTAVLDGLLAVSPCFQIEQPEARTQHFDPLTPAQVEVIAQHAAPRYTALVVLGVACGPRFCEAAGLAEAHVLAHSRLLRIERQLDRHNSCPTRSRSEPCPYAPPQLCCGAAFGPPKSAAGTRDIPIPALGMDALNQRLHRFAQAPCGLLFTTPAGKALNPANWRSRVWKPLIRALPQVPYTTTYHHLRHTYASLLAGGRHGAPKTGPEDEKTQVNWVTWESVWCAVRDLNAEPAVKSRYILVLIHLKRYHRVRSVTTPPERYPATIRAVPSHATRCPDVRSPTALQQRHMDPAHSAPNVARRR